MFLAKLYDWNTTNCIEIYVYLSLEFGLLNVVNTYFNVKNRVIQGKFVMRIVNL